MKRLFFGAVIVLSSAAFCSAGDKYELGIIVGEPTGISFKQNQAGHKAIDAAAAWSFSGKDSLHLHADQLWFKNDVFKVEQGRLPLYYGVGLRVKLEDRSRLGIRIPVGLQYFFPKSEFTMFLEIAPVLDIAPDTDLELNAALGVRLRL